MERFKKRLLRPGGVVLSGFFLMVSAGFSLASDETIPPESWIYQSLRTFELLGLVNLEPTLPYSRKEVELYLSRILQGLNNGGISLNARQRFQLGRLREEFQGKCHEPAQREDRPVYVCRDGASYFALDLSVGGGVRKMVDSKKGEVDGLMFPSVLFDIDRRVTLETSYWVTMAPERGLNRRNRKPSPRERSFRGVTSEYERAYISCSGARWKVLLGRDYIHWGSNREEGLLISNTAGSLDHLAACISIGRFKLSMVQAVLDPEFPRHLAGHRLVIRLPRGIYLGIGETVVYTGRGFDFTYLMPAGSYYANQFNESGDDNILWALDWKIPLRRGLIIHGEFLVDDFQYERDPPAPDRLGANLAAEVLMMPYGHQIELQAGYTYIDIYTYAHKDHLFTRYVAGDGTEDLNRYIGSTLGPDADRWSISSSVPIHPRIVVSVGGSITRRGEGNGFVEWDREKDPNPRFPSGDVVTEKEFFLGNIIDMERGSSLSAGGGWRIISGKGEDRTDGFAYLEFILDL